MRLDMSHALRHDECLPNPSALAGARWGEASVDMSHALRHDECLPNPSAVAGAGWGGAGVTPSPSIPLPRGAREETPLSPRGRGVGERGKLNATHLPPPQPQAKNINPSTSAPPSLKTP